MTCCKASQGRSCSAQTEPRSLPTFLPRNQTMLAGSTPTSTARPWKKLSSRQATRTNSLQRASKRLRTLPAASPAALDPAPDRGPRGSLPRSQKQGQQDLDLSQTQPHGRGLCREPLLLGCGDLDGPVHPLPQPGILLAKRLVFPGQLFAGRASGALGLNRTVDLSGLIINSLTATVDSACLDGNGTANAAETGGCIRDPKRNGYGTHGGWASVRVGLWLFPLCRTTPPSDQEEPGKSLPSVKLKNPNLPGFGTVPLCLALFWRSLGPNRVLFSQSGVNSAALRAVKLSPALITWLFRKSCTTVRSSELVSACQGTHPPRAALRWGDARACVSHRIEKDHPHYPDILSLRQNCPSLGSVSGTWSPLDGTSAIVVGSFCRNQPHQYFSLRPFSPVSHAPALLLDPLIPGPLQRRGLVYARAARTAGRARGGLPCAHDRDPGPRAGNIPRRG